MTTFGIKLLKWLLRRPLTVEEANSVTEIILSNIGGLPFKDIIRTDGRQLFINEKPIDLEKARQLREYALSALENPALTIIREQTAFTAITLGVHKAEVPAQMFFARAALWWGQNEIQLLETLAQKEPDLTQDL